MRHLYDDLMEDTSVRCLPISALFELTYSCNTRCHHCYLAGPRRGRITSTSGELSTHEVFSILGQLADNGVLFLGFSGGEPLLRRDFFDIALRARDLGFALRIFTNGTLVDEDISRRIADLDPLEVEISLYGAQAPTHDHMTRVGGSFFRTMRGAKNLIRKKVKVNLKAPLMRVNYMEYHGMNDLAERIGAGFFYDTQIVPRDNGDRCSTVFNMTEDNMRDFYRGKATRFVDGNFGKDIMDLPYCNTGRNTLAISPYGDVFPCVQIRRSAGSLREKTLAEIWTSSPVLKKIRRMSLGNYEECASCDLFAFCFHCPGVALLETGRFLACSPLAKSQAVALRKSARE